MNETTNNVVYHAIGVIRTPFVSIESMPIQSVLSTVKGRILLEEAYADALAGLEGFSHIILIYEFHKASPYRNTVTPFLDDEPKGLFATRAPCRPNPIGLSVVRLESIRGNTLNIRGADMLDGTPLLDVKPYVSAFDAYPDSKDGWLSSKRKKMEGVQSDSRFI
jgi:tRNA-Thr(GGU) m(6)t(6)A37 methyltransferase TsaA